jgi:hypothetical protein
MLDQWDDTMLEKCKLCLMIVQPEEKFLGCKGIQLVDFVIDEVGNKGG